MEKWKDVSGYEGLYQVSSYGRVKSLERLVSHRLCGMQKVSEKILKQGNATGGYKCLNLSKNNIKKSISAHRLVALTFIPNPLNLPEVNHIDEIKTNNHVTNLEWCSKKYNLNYRDTQKRIKKSNYKSIQGKKRGVFWKKVEKKWRAAIGYKGKEIHLGYFFVKEDAYKAYYDKYLEIYKERPW